MKYKFVILFGILAIASYSMSAVTMVDIYVAVDGKNRAKGDIMTALKSSECTRQKINTLMSSVISSASLQNEDNLRKTILLDEDWKFIQKDVKDASLPEYNDADWEIVTVPHDWAINKPFDMNIDWQVVQVKADFETIPQLRTGRTGALPCYGIGWYRKSIYISSQGSKLKAASINLK